MDRNVAVEPSRTNNEVSYDLVLLALLLVAWGQQLRREITGKHESSNACRSMVYDRMAFNIFKPVTIEAADGGGDRMKCCHELQCYARTLFMI